MRVNTRFTVAIHILVLVALSDAHPATSEMMAESVGSHPVVIRQVMSLLKKRDLWKHRTGFPAVGFLNRKKKLLYAIYIKRLKIPKKASFLMYIKTLIPNVLSDAISFPRWTRLFCTRRTQWKMR